MISEADLLRLRAARHRHAEEVLESIRTNESLMRQVRESWESLQRGEPWIPWEQVQAEAQAQHRRDEGHTA